MRTGNLSSKCPHHLRGGIVMGIAIALFTTLSGASAALADDIELPIPGWTFNTPGDTQGWTAGNGIVSLEASEVGLEVATTGADPWIISSTIAVSTDEVNTVTIRARNAGPNEIGKIYWERTDAGLSEGLSSVFPMQIGATEFTDYVIDLRTHPGWAGTISRLRIDPGENAGEDGAITIASIIFSFNDEEVDIPGTDEREEVPHVGTVAPITATENQLLISGSAPGVSDVSWELYELDAWQYEADFTDGELLGTAAAAEDFTFAVPRFDRERDRLFSKFVVVGNSGTEAIFVDSPRYATVMDFPATNDFPFPSPLTKKGLQVQLTDDAEEIGVGHAAINIAFDRVLLAANEGPEKTIEFVVDGQIYYFDKEYMDEIDRTIRPLSDNRMLVNAILIVYDDASSNPGAPDLLIHPDTARNEGTVFAFNTVDENSRYFKATLEFLAQRYSREDQQYGRIVGWIVGNEVNSPWTWQNQGDATVNVFMDNYERALRWTYLATTKQYREARTYISLDHFWAQAMTPQLPVRSYAGRTVIDRLAHLMDEAGDFPWNVAYHPYPENLMNPATWNDATAVDSFDSPRITFKNLHVLGQYLQQDNFLFDGEQRRIILSEQGFHAPSNSQADQDLQAAAYAYGYYRAVTTSGIDSFILHRHVDHKREGGLRLGLWTWDEERSDPASPDYQRRIYDVFTYIDTAKSREYTEFGLPIVGAESWESLFPELDIEGQGTRPLPQVLPTDFTELATGVSLSPDQWLAGENANSVSVTNNQAIVDFDVLDKQWRGATMPFTSPLDVSASPSYQVHISVPGTTPQMQREIKLKAYSGDNVATGTAMLSEENSVVSLDLANWDGRDSIDRVKVWLRGSSNSDWSGHFSIVNAAFTASPTHVVGANLTFTAVADSLAANAPVAINVTNNGSFPFGGDLTPLSTGTVALHEESLSVPTVAPSETVTVRGTIASVAEGKPTLHIRHGDRTISVPVTMTPVAPEPDPDRRILYDFEDGTQGWQPGNAVDAVAQVSSYANAPGTPWEGDYALEVESSIAPANEWRSTFVSENEAVSLQNATALMAYINAYGGMGSVYTARISLTTDQGIYRHIQTVNNDSWNELRMPLDGVEGDLTELEFSFRAEDASADWKMRYQLDGISLEAVEPDPDPDPEPTPNPPPGPLAEADLPTAAQTLTIEKVDYENHRIAVRVSEAFRDQNLQFYVYSDPQAVGEYRAGVDGRLSVNLNTNLATGKHVLAAYKSDGTLAEWASFTWEPPITTPPRRELANTGAGWLIPLISGVAMCMLGAMAIYSRRTQP